jgi:hypothetical protein
MALRHERGARLRRPARGRLGVAALVVGLYLAAGVAATSPALWQGGFVAGGEPGLGEAAPGDHLQSNYRLWLVGHQLGQGRAPWLDPYTFKPEVRRLPNFAGWPFGFAYWPLHALFGDVGGWNAFVVLSYLGAGGLTFLWLRALGIGLGGALAGGLAFALAPYRVEQSVGHLLGPVSMLLPLALWAVERRRGWLVVLATASIPLSGQVHLALGTTAFVVLYALLRARGRAGALVGAAAAVAAGLVYQHLLIRGSIEAGGRSLAEVASYSAQWQDFVSRGKRHGGESFVFLGWATPVAAVAGAVLLARARRLALLALLLVAVVVPALLALGTNLPLYDWLWQHAPGFRFPRVPERLLPIACLGIAGLVAVAVGRLRSVALVALALVALGADLRFTAYQATAAGPGRAAVAGAPPGRVLELPVFLPDDHLGSLYFLDTMAAERERPLGYALGPDSTDRLARALTPLTCGDWSGQATRLEQLGVGSIVVHGGLYAHGPRGIWFAWRSLLAHGWAPAAQAGRVTRFARGAHATVEPPPQPSRTEIVRCGGWRTGVVEVPPGLLWAYGGTTLQLHLASTARAVVSLDGSVRAASTGALELRLPLAPGGWHLIRIDRRGHGTIRLVSATRD